MSNKSTVTTIEDEQATVQETAAKAVKATVVDPDFTGEKAEITIAHGHGVEGKQAVFLNVNNSSYLIPRGVKVVIPMEALHALNNCVQDTYEPNEKGETEVRQVNRFSVNVHRMIAAEKAAKAK